MRRRGPSLRQSEAYEFDYRVWVRTSRTQPQFNEALVPRPDPAAYGVGDWEAEHLRAKVEQEFRNGNQP